MSMYAYILSVANINSRHVRIHSIRSYSFLIIDSNKFLHSGMIFSAE